MTRLNRKIVVFCLLLRFDQLITHLLAQLIEATIDYLDHCLAVPIEKMTFRA